MFRLMLDSRHDLELEMTPNKITIRVVEIGVGVVLEERIAQSFDSVVDIVEAWRGEG